MNRARILQLFSTMVYPGLEISSSHERWLLVRNPKARIKHEKRTGVGEGIEKQEERASGESKAEDVRSRNWKRDIKNSNCKWEERWEENKI